ncbi:hypothetical protein IW262DRAFT_1001186 [Armillaria fumosa]|nr:hypothetical protein IW262DRAFT_1001186 [Armillaria fumosa]
MRLPLHIFLRTFLLVVILSGMPQMVGRWDKMVCVFRFVRAFHVEFGELGDCASNIPAQSYKGPRIRIRHTRITKTVLTTTATAIELLLYVYHVPLLTAWDPSVIL